MPLLLLLFILVLPTPVFAQAALENYYNYNTRAVQPSAAPEKAKEKVKQETEPQMDGAKRHVVTSVQKCFDEIGAEAAAKIRARSLTPYADCQKVLREKAARDKKAAESESAAGPETPRNFKRVTETPPEAETSNKAASKPVTGKKTEKAVK